MTPVVYTLVSLQLLVCPKRPTLSSGLPKLSGDTSARVRPAWRSGFIARRNPFLQSAAGFARFLFPFHADQRRFYNPLVPRRSSKKHAKTPHIPPHSSNRKKVS